MGAVLQMNGETLLRINRRRFVQGLPPLVEAAVRPSPRQIAREELERERLISRITAGCDSANR